MALASACGLQAHSPAKRQATCPIYSVTPFTMLDFPGRTACIIWFSGCNMRCPYCHNPQIVKGKGHKDVEQVLEFLNKRTGLLDGVVLSGGEASIYPELPDFIQKVKKLGYAVKLDTNGLRPERIADFIKQDLLDYIALDYKAPPQQFKKVSGVDKYNTFTQTLDVLCNQDIIPFEVRTTVHTDLMNEQHVQEIINDLAQRKFNGHYFVQNFRANNGQPTLGFLKNQKRVLNIESLKHPPNFTVGFRNF